MIIQSKYDIILYGLPVMLSDGILLWMAMVMSNTSPFDLSSPTPFYVFFAIASYSTYIYIKHVTLFIKQYYKRETSQNTNQFP